MADRFPRDFRTPPPIRMAHEVVFDYLCDALLSGSIAPGTHLPAEGLAQKLGVSHQPIREALKILEGAGQLEYRARKGYFVARLDLEDLRELYRLRELLEGEALRLGLPRIGHEELQRLQDQHDFMSAPENDISAVTRANRRFHFTLFEAAGMRHLERLIHSVWDATDPYRARFLFDDENRQAANIEHERIIEALAEGDIDATMLLLNSHRRTAISRLTESLEGRLDHTSEVDLCEEDVPQLPESPPF